MTATTCRLVATLVGMALVTSFAAAEGTMKGSDYVRVVADQMHQLEIVKVGPYAFRVQRSAIGHIAFNEEATTNVLTPFSGRVIRLIANVGSQVKRGDPLLEIDSPEQVAPQNEFIAAQTAKTRRAPSSIWRRSSRSASAISMRARPPRSRNCSRPRRNSPPPRATCGRPTRRSRPPASACASLAAPMRKLRRSSRPARSAASPRSLRRSTAPSSRARSGRVSMSRPIPARRCT